VLPGVALQELWQVVRGAEKALLAISAAALLIGVCGMLAVLLSGMQQRRHEVAVLRALGASPLRIAALLLLESLLLTLSGLLLGLLLLWGGISLLQQPALELYGLQLGLNGLSSGQWQLAGLILVLGILSGLIPAFMAYRMALAQGLGQRH
jgi:putative ABC transport system permease protein